MGCFNGLLLFACSQIDGFLNSFLRFDGEIIEVIIVYVLNNRETSNVLPIQFKPPF